MNSSTYLINSISITINIVDNYNIYLGVFSIYSAHLTVLGLPQYREKLDLETSAHQLVPPIYSVRVTVHAVT